MATKPSKIALDHYQPPPHTQLEILYQDDYLLLANKPSGLLSVPGRGENKQDSLASRVQLEYPQALIVHRLDMPTSGIMLMALDKQTHSLLSQLFQQRQVKKVYTAIVEGQLSELQGEIELPLITDWPNRPLQKVDHQIGKHSLTHYKVIEYLDDTQTSRIQLMPITGRSHQLRVHLSAMGHAILGDQFYAPQTVQQAAERLLLHASELSFTHPHSGEPILVQCEPGF